VTRSIVSETTPALAPVVIGLGGNLGEPIHAFRGALDGLARLTRIGAISRLYRSSALGPAQPDYLNAAVLLDFAGSLVSLLQEIQDLEIAAGRKRTVRWGPRTLDLDILWAGSRVEATSTLSVPHSALKSRAFALLPLLDVFPDACDPLTGEHYSQLALARQQPSCKSVEGVNWWVDTGSPRW
jgi:2-amino-4-hydroxy-6-hydroxymethyldihydropteridine diphosphokinase